MRNAGSKELFDPDKITRDRGMCNATQILVTNGKRYYRWPRAIKDELLPKGYEICDEIDGEKVYDDYGLLKPEFRHHQRYLLILDHKMNSRIYLDEDFDFTGFRNNQEEVNADREVAESLMEDYVGGERIYSKEF